MIEEYLNISLTIIGIFALLVSFFLIRNFKEILRINDYNINQWNLVSLLVVFFGLAYSAHLIIVFNFVSPPFSILLLVSMVYFFGSVFVIVTMRTTNRMIQGILGDKISDEDTYQIFLNRVGGEHDGFKHLRDDFHITCEFCNKELDYNIPLVIRSHARVLDRGVTVMNTFGVRSFILRPSHTCQSGRREITVVHDEQLSFRAIDNSRLIFGGEL